MLNLKKAALHNLGCKVNAYETQAMEEMLENAGYSIVDFDEKADVYIINTCSVTNIADRKSRQMIHKCKKLNPNSCVVATGCYVQNFGKNEKETLGADIILGNNLKNRLIEELDEFFKKNECIVNCIDINDGFVDYEYMNITKDAEHTRAFVKVQDGCNQFCTYCIIPFARGRVRSRDINDVKKELEALAKAGYKEVVITGIHLSSYGLNEGYDLCELLEMAQKIEGIERIRLGSLEPQIITEEFAGRIQKLSKLCPHFHLSLQSGCDTVLKRMNRKYSSNEYKKGCDILRKTFRNPAITTDVIAGFPGETEDEFNITFDFVKDISFYEMHVFPYSKRAGTKAASMSGQLNNVIKKERANKLIQLADAMSDEYRKGFVGDKLSVLFEEITLIEGKEYYVGYSREYLKCALPANNNNCRVNELLEVKAVSYDLCNKYVFVEIC